MADEALTAGAVARRLGVAVTTLRTWHQRYGLGPSQHTPGQHRRYTPEDLERLQVMRRLTGQGVAPAEAAAWARRVPVDGVRPGTAGGLPCTTRDGGGHTIRTGRAGPAARGLARAAMRLDAPALRDILATAVADRGVIGAWQDVIMPVLIGIGDRYAATRRFIEVEHLISRSVTEVLSSVARPPSSRAPRVMLAAADEEQHTLPLEALAAALAEAGVPSRLLGARVPPQALADAVARTGPAAIVLWSQFAETGDPAQWTRLLSAGHGPLLAAAAGPGWPADRLPPGVVRLDSLGEAVRRVAATVRECPAPG
ncbi:MerR family transcriptional regulator [Couchioplanes azureus]|uniref:MerR family transcriptional regulator n=1 Tax=Couchioplanes caeruleus TaxID=56438 RepID=UPI00167160E0|nr:MerR family transcriptional regulator [Couchioplanes caeruleus]GGQ46850.1 transcriptional regulator [Couchioplanes caeruleus subsp. azureus]